MDIDLLRIAGGGGRVTSSTSADTFLWAGNVNAGQAFDQLYVYGSTGVLYAVNEIDGFTDSAGIVVGDIRTELGRIKVGGGVSYLWNDSFEPYVDAFLRHDYNFTQRAAPPVIQTIRPTFGSGLESDTTAAMHGPAHSVTTEHWVVTALSPIPSVS